MQKTCDGSVPGVSGKSEEVCRAHGEGGAQCCETGPGGASTRVTWVLVGLSKNFGFYSKHDGE